MFRLRIGRLDGDRGPQDDCEGLQSPGAGHVCSRQLSDGPGCTRRPLIDSVGSHYVWRAPRIAACYGRVWRNANERIEVRNVTESRSPSVVNSATAKWAAPVWM